MDWQIILQWATIGVNLISGVGLVPLVNFIKTKLELNGRYAQLLTMVVVVIFTILNLILMGKITPELLTPEKIGQVLIAILLASQAEYQRLKNVEVRET